MLRADRARELDVDARRLRESPDTALVRDPKAVRAATDAGAVQTLVLSAGWLFERPDSSGAAGACFSVCFQAPAPR